MFADVGEIHSRWLPERPNFEIRRDSKSDAGLRDKILQRASREGAQFSKAAKAKPPLSPVEAEREPRVSFLPFWRTVNTEFVLAAGLIVVAAVALFGGRKLSHHAPGQDFLAASLGGNKSMETGVAPAATQAPADGTASEIAAFQERESELQLALKEAQAEKQRLQSALADFQGKAKIFERGNLDSAQRVADLQRQLMAAAAGQEKAEAELLTQRNSQSASEAAIQAQNQEIRDLNAKLEEQAAGLDREQQLLSVGREVRDVIAARNLHIIDVYDTDGSGKTKKAFGRAFYTEGKSLIFYAYDLPTHRAEDAKYAFYAWGKQAANEQSVRSLGILYNDDQSQKRWVLKVTNPEVLSQIDSVFVTFERTDNPGNQPHGKEILSAYLRTPANHP